MPTLRSLWECSVIASVVAVTINLTRDSDKEGAGDETSPRMRVSSRRPQVV